MLRIEEAGEWSRKVLNLLPEKNEVPITFLGESCLRMSEADLGFIMKVNLPDSSRIFLDNDPRNSRSQSGEIKFYSEIYTPGFIHYRAGGNWDGYAHHSQRKKHLFNFFDVLLNQ